MTISAILFRTLTFGFRADAMHKGNKPHTLGACSSTIVSAIYDAIK